MNNQTKFIIGGGISGLIFAYYNRDYKIISPNIGGKLRNEYLTSTVLLHDTPETRRLILDLKLNLEPKAHIIKYFYQGKLLENASVNLREIMVTKKLTLWNELKNLKIELPISDTTLSTNDIYIPILKISVKKIIETLAQKTNSIKDKVIRITQDEIITEKSRYKYTELALTIPAPIFWRLYGQEKNLKYLPETFVLTKTNPIKEKNNLLHWDLVYFLDQNIPYTRVNRHDKDSFLYEFTGKIGKKEIKKLLPGVEVIHTFTDPYGIVVTDLNNIPPPKIRFIGRFATWNHTNKIQDVIRDSLTRYDFTSIWNKQKNFNSNFFNFNVQDVKLQQELTKEFALHIEDEVHELLGEINWKMSQYRIKEIDRKKLLEEWIDIFKYWLGVGSIWGFTLEDFSNEFWRKSAIVDERYKKYIKEVKKYREKS